MIDALKSVLLIQNVAFLCRMHFVAGGANQLSVTENPAAMCQISEKVIVFVY